MTVWFNPAFDMPKSDESVIIIASGRDELHNIRFERAMLFGEWNADDGWWATDYLSADLTQIFAWTPCPKYVTRFDWEAEHESTTP